MVKSKASRTLDTPHNRLMILASKRNNKGEMVRRGLDLRLVTRAIGSTTLEKQVLTGLGRRHAVALAPAFSIRYRTAHRRSVTWLARRYGFAAYAASADLRFLRHTFSPHFPAAFTDSHRRFAGRRRAGRVRRP